MRPLHTSFHLLSISLFTLGVFTAACNEASVGVDSQGSGGIDSIGTDGSSTGPSETGSVDDTVDSSGSESGPPVVDPCLDGKQGGDETDVDCGGSTCEPCAAGGNCDENADCASEICTGGFCQTPTCYDGLQNGEEEGVDCGGGCPNTCVSDGCVHDNQCGAGTFCNAEGSCEASSCENGIEDTFESDVDCGGGDCLGCADGDTCEVDDDCLSKICDPTDGTCTAGACDDSVKNGDETDTDCGGSCDVCVLGDECLVGSDCIELSCEFGTCVAADCTDTVLNGNETDTDCGGPSCNPCQTGDVCEIGEDCTTGVCDPDVLLCVGADCDDDVLNGDETDVDCGGSCGATCLPDAECNSSGDCVEQVCEFGVCSQPDCGDVVQNGDETGVDCGGQCGATCEPGEGCAGDLDCAEEVCDLVLGVCSDPQCDDLIQNGDETDEDCGGACGATCDPGESCFDGGDCAEGVCILAECQPASCDDGVQNGTESGLDCAGGCPKPCPTGNEIVVNATLADFQVQPAIAAAPGGGFYAVFWGSFPVNSPAQDGSGAGVFGQFYAASGLPVGGEFQVNTSVGGNQQFPAADAYDGGTVVVWQSAGTDGDDAGVYGQRYDAGGAAVGGEFLVNQTVSGAQRRPDVAVGPDGAFIVCWEGEVLTFEVFCRRYDAAGSPVAGEFQVNTITSNHQQLAVVERDDAGNFTVAWQAAGNHDGSGVGVYRRRFGSNGAALEGADVLVNQFTTGDQSGPVIAMNGDGAVVIAWSSDLQDGSSTEVYARRYAANGGAAGAEFRANTTIAGAQNNPAVALNSAGDFVIVWQTADDGALTGVFAQRYDGAGATVSTEFLVNPTIAGLQEQPDVALRGASEIVAVWSAGDSGFTNRDIMLQRYDAQFP